MFFQWKVVILDFMARWVFCSSNCANIAVKPLQIHQGTLSTPAKFFVLTLVLDHRVLTLTQTCLEDHPSVVDLPSFNFLLACRISASVIGSSKIGTWLLVVKAKGVSSRMIDFYWKCSPRASAEGYSMLTCDVVLPFDFIPKLFWIFKVENFIPAFYFFQCNLVTDLLYCPILIW